MPLIARDVRDRDQKKNFSRARTGTEKKNYRDQIKRVTGTWTGTKKNWSRTYLLIAIRIIYGIVYGSKLNR
jgi:hypothetical protein